MMPDWNPAEIIGTSPSKLSVSLYNYLIMNNIWAKQRSEFGYYDTRPQKLMFLFCGKPYVDIRASFLSFTLKILQRKLLKIGKFLYR